MNRNKEMLDCLVKSLSPTDFELLLRAYVRKQMARFDRDDMNNSYTRAYFYWNGDDKSSWDIRAGHGYPGVETKGEVLVLCAEELDRRIGAEDQNKLSLLTHEEPLSMSLGDEIPF